MKFYHLVLLPMLAALSACTPYYKFGPENELAPQKGPLTAQFFGVSTILLNDGYTSIMTDGFFSRLPPSQFLFSKISPNQTRIKSVLKKGEVANLAAVLVAHSHYDHAFDSARVAKLKHALLVGSQSTANIAKGEDFPERCFREITRNPQRFRFGNFDVTVILAYHSIGTPGEERRRGFIASELRPPADYDDYKDGESYSFLVTHGGVTILIHPSANFIKGMYKGVQADVVFLGVATLAKRDPEFVKKYWAQVVEETGARLVIPIHWDDFSHSLDEGLKLEPYPIDNIPWTFARLQELADESPAERRIQMKFMPLIKPVDIVAAAGPPWDGRPWPPAPLPPPDPRPSSCP